MSQEEGIKLHIKNSLKIIRLYDWLLDLYVLDYFVDNHWSKLPESWQKNFNNIDPQHMGKILSGQPTSHLFPLSFLALMKLVDIYSIPRKDSPENNKQDTCSGQSLLKENGYGLNLVSTSNEHQEIDSDKSKHTKLKKLFLKHVKLKKRHEISLMADLVHKVAVQSGCNAVIDFGSGVGHLVRMLAYKYDLYAAGIESQSQLTDVARKLDAELEYTASKHLSQIAISNLHRPHHFNMTLSCHSQLRTLALPPSMVKYGLIGLHPCGDLGPLLIRHFVNYPQVKFVCIVGCCYMKLTCGKNGSYPLSNFVAQSDSHLSYVSREIACHAIEVYCDRLQKGNYEDLKVHAYRAALERILVEYDPKLKHTQVRSIKHSDTMTFERYCALALERLNIPLTTCREIMRRGNEDLQQWRRIVIVYTLRLTLAPLVESVILLDRMLYLIENGLSCEIRPVFDPTLSPRNHVIIARR